MCIRDRMGSVLALFIYSNVTEELRKSNAGTLSQIALSLIHI